LNEPFQLENVRAVLWLSNAGFMQVLAIHGRKRHNHGRSCIINYKDQMGSAG
jgi:hypothetical protein